LPFGADETELTGTIPDRRPDLRHTTPTSERDEQRHQRNPGKRGMAKFREAEGEKHPGEERQPVIHQDIVA
jgi:hypothetical protein